VTEPQDEFVSSLFRDRPSVDLDVDSAYASVQQRVQHVKRRRMALVSGAACVALFGGVVLAGSRIGTPDGERPGGPATDPRGNLIPAPGSTTSSAVPPTTVIVGPPAVTSTEPTATVAVTNDDGPANSAATASGGSSGAEPTTSSGSDNAEPTTSSGSDDAPTTSSGNSGAPNTTVDDGQSGDEGPGTTDGNDDVGGDDGSGGDDRGEGHDLGAGSEESYSGGQGDGVGGFSGG